MDSRMHGNDGNQVRGNDGNEVRGNDGNEMDSRVRGNDGNLGAGVPNRLEFHASSLRFAMRFTIATYNIHKGFSHLKRRMVIHELRDKLRELDADIMFLQEVQGVH